MKEPSASGNRKRVITGIGLVSCVYVNSASEQFWVIDYRIFDPDTDGKSKLDHVQEMLKMVQHRQLPFQTVLIDAWYAAKEVMLQQVRPSTAHSRATVWWTTVAEGQVVQRSLTYASKSWNGMKLSLCMANWSRSGAFQRTSE